MLEPVESSPALKRYLSETREIPCADLFVRFVQNVAGLGSDVGDEVGSWGVKFRVGRRTLCEISPYGDLFRVRVGEEQAIEYRVRNEETAMHALDQILLAYLHRRQEADTSVGPPPSATAGDE